jgi:hypothetical protein
MAQSTTFSLATASTVVAIVTGLIGIGTAVGAYNLAQARTETAVTDIARRQEAQHKNVEDRVQRLWTELKGAQTDLVMARERIAKLEAIQSELSSTKERVAKLEVDNEWLKTEPVRTKTAAEARMH